MAKSPLTVAAATPPEPRRSRLPHGFMIWILAAVLAPFLWEGAVICHSQWCEITGRPTEAHTPILNAIQQSFESAQASLQESMEYHFRDIHCDPATLLIIGGALVIMAMVMLRAK
jgi:hypothetical protein